MVECVSRAESVTSRMSVVEGVGTDVWVIEGAGRRVCVVDGVRKIEGRKYISF